MQSYVRDILRMILIKMDIIDAKEIGVKAIAPHPRLGLSKNNDGDEHDVNWGEQWQVLGPFSTNRLTIADFCEFAEYKIDAGNHEGFARVYGKANAERIVACLTACSGMEDPISAIENLKLNQQRDC